MNPDVASSTLAFDLTDSRLAMVANVHEGTSLVTLVARARVRGERDRRERNAITPEGCINGVPLDVQSFGYLSTSVLLAGQKFNLFLEVIELPERVTDIRRAVLADAPSMKRAPDLLGIVRNNPSQVFSLSSMAFWIGAGEWGFPYSPALNLASASVSIAPYPWLLLSASHGAHLFTFLSTTHRRSQ